MRRKIMDAVNDELPAVEPAEAPIPVVPPPKQKKVRPAPVVAAPEPLPTDDRPTYCTIRNPRTGKLEIIGGAQ